MLNDRTRHDFKKAIEADDREAITALLCDHAELRGALDAPLFDWGQPALARARSVETARLLLDEGASLEGVARSWAPGFCVITGVDVGVGRFLAERGAALTPHAAAGLGLREMIDADPGAVHAKEGDGCTPLAFARDIGPPRDRGGAASARRKERESRRLKGAPPPEGRERVRAPLRTGDWAGAGWRRSGAGYGCAAASWEAPAAW